VVFIVSDALTFSGFLAAYGFLDLNLLRHGLWPMKCLLTFHLCMVYLRRCIMSFNDFILIFSSVTMVLAVDAGHQMKKDKVIIYMF
jgi:cytochrome c oxidase subunit 3